MQTAQPLRGVLLILFASMAFAMMGACVKAIPSDLSTAEVVWVRSVVVLLILVPWMLWQRTSFRGRHPLFLFLRALSGFLAMFLYFFTLRRLSLATAVVLNYTSPIFVMLLSIPFLKERVSFSLAAAFFVSFIGLVCLAQPEFPLRGPAFLAGLVSGCLVAIAYITISYLGRFESPLTVIFHFTLWSILFVTPPTVLHFQKPTSPDWLFLIGAGLFACAGQWGMTKAYFHGPASVISVFSAITPLLAYLIGFLFWQETLTPLGGTGIALIVTASAFLSVQYHRRGL